MTPEELADVLQRHILWLKGESGGERADLGGGMRKTGAWRALSRLAKPEGGPGVRYSIPHRR
jgi:hypothetical protein